MDFVITASAVLSGRINGTINEESSSSAGKVMLIISVILIVLGVLSGILGVVVVLAGWLNPENVTYAPYLVCFCFHSPFHFFSSVLLHFAR